MQEQPKCAASSAALSVGERMALLEADYVACAETLATLPSGPEHEAASYKLRAISDLMDTTMGVTPEMRRIEEQNDFEFYTRVPGAPTAA